MGKIHNSLEVGVTYNSVDIKPVKGLKQSVGPGTACNRDSHGKCQPPAQSLSVTVSYAVYIKATGNPPPPGGKIEDNNTYSVFQVDGVLGLNSKPNSNFKPIFLGWAIFSLFPVTRQLLWWPMGRPVWILALFRN